MRRNFLSGAGPESLTSEQLAVLSGASVDGSSALLTQEVAIDCNGNVWMIATIGNVKGDHVFNDSTADRHAALLTSSPAVTRSLHQLLGIRAEVIRHGA